MEDAVHDIEKHFDEAWDGLGITKLPLYIAIYTILATAEGLFELRLMPQQMIHLRQALEILIPHVFAKCDKRSNKIDLSKIKSVTNEELETVAIEAIVFAQRYAWFSYHVTGYYQGQNQCQVIERSITFSGKSRRRAVRSLMKHDLKRYHEDHAINVNELSRLEKESPPDDLWNYYAIG